MRTLRVSVWTVVLLILAGVFSALLASNYNLTPINTDPDARRSIRVVLDGGIKVTIRLQESTVVQGSGSGSAFESFWYSQNPDTHWERLGFEWGEVRELRDLDQTIAAGQYAVSVAYTGKLPAWVTIAFLNSVALVSLIHKPRRRAGFCVNCGFDIRPTPQRCPVCGTIVEQNRRRVRWGHLGKVD